MIGKHLSHYLIEAELGRGGMGIVYRARDTKLDRTVAIKVLPSAALASEDDRARFYREAKAAAALTHPHIAIIHGVDEAVVEGDKDEELRPFIAMEFIEGATLEDRISKGPLKLEDALRIAREIASALKLAHTNEIVHRDIKSANVMLTNDGTAKVLDFGLAQTAKSTKLTRMGSTLGTVAYMSPEQARGEAVDSRTDLYSLGTVLYEMITGRLPFGGAYEQAVVYGILNQDPEPITALRTGVPMELERIVNKLLAKTAGRRYQSCADLIVDLESVTVAGSSHVTSTSAIGTSSFSTIGPLPAQGQTPVPSQSDWKQRFFWGISVAAALVGLGLGVFGSAVTAPDPVLKPLHRVELTLPGMSFVRFTRLSPDGAYLAFVGVDTHGRIGIFLRELATDRIRFLEDTQEAERLGFDFSPDGTQIAFSSRVNGGVFTVEVPTGIPERKTDIGRFVYWEDNDTILFTDDRPGGEGTFRLDLSSGITTPVPLDGPELPDGYNYIVKTHVPGSDRVFGHELGRSNIGTIEGDHKIFTADLSTGVLEPIEPFTINPEYVAGGFLMYQLRDDDGKLVVRPVDDKTGQFTGQPLDVFDEGMTVPWSSFTVSSNGDLLFTVGTQSFSAQSSLWKVDLEKRTSSRLNITLPVPLQAGDPSLSADDSRIIFRAAQGGSGDIYEFDRDELLQYQITSDRRNYSPTYDPVDGSRVFSRSSANGREIVRLDPGPLSGESPEVIWGLGSGVAFSDDGRWMAFSVRDSVDSEVSMVLLDRSTDEIVWEDSTGSASFLPHFSPDSRYLAYNRLVDQNEELVVVPVSGLPKFVIPNTSGTGPKWSGDGNYLFYWVPEGIERIPVRTRPTFNILGNPELMMPLQTHRGWDVSADGNTIFVVTPKVDFGDVEVTEITVNWYQNWSDHLKKEFSK